MTNIIDTFFKLDPPYKLKSCPFCGGDPEYVIRVRDIKRKNADDTLCMAENTEIRCKNDDCWVNPSICLFISCVDTQDEITRETKRIFKYWNNRVD